VASLLTPAIDGESDVFKRRRYLFWPIHFFECGGDLLAAPSRHVNGAKQPTVGGETVGGETGGSPFRGR
jgi:hypothetical protein